MADAPQLPDRPMAEADAADEQARRSKVWFWRTLVTAAALTVAGVYQIWHEVLVAMRGGHSAVVPPSSDLHQIA